MHICSTWVDMTEQFSKVIMPVCVFTSEYMFYENSSCSLFFTNTWYCLFLRYSDGYVALSQSGFNLHLCESNDTEHLPIYSFEYPLSWNTWFILLLIFLKWIVCLFLIHLQELCLYSGWVHCLIYKLRIHSTLWLPSSL